MKYICFIIAVVIVIVFTVWNQARMEIQAQAYADYEECVQERTGMSVSAYYQKYGYAPECF